MLRRNGGTIATAIALAWALLGASPGVTPAWAADQLLMPFACVATAGKPVLTPAPDQIYRILGAHEQQPFTACAQTDPDRCRTWMLHKFDLDCGGARVPWLAVASQSLQQRPWRGWVADGRVHLRMGSQWGPLAAPAGLGGAPQRIAAGPTPDCVRPPPSSIGRVDGARLDGPRRVRPLGPECAPRFRPNPPSVLTMPAGFAPVLDTGARFVTLPTAAAAARASTKVASADGAIPSTTGEGGAPAASGTWETTATRAPVRTAYIDAAAASGPVISGREWGVALAQAAVSGTGLGGRLDKGGLLAGQSPAMLALWSLVGLALLGAAGFAVYLFLRRRRSPRSAFDALHAVGLAAAARDAADEIEQHESVRAAECATMIGDADRLHSRVRLSVETLEAPTLRDTLLEDLLRIEATLLAPDLANHVMAHEWTAARAILQQMLRELVRVQRLAEGARGVRPAPGASHGAVWALGVPRNRKEACALLGVNENASEKVVKKIVDALRQTWHPDHASDADDRFVREERLKQINIAWDLISKRQREAA